MPYTLPQEELVKMFSEGFLRSIASTLLIQKHKTFEEAISQAIVIEKVKIQYGELKGKNKEPYVRNRNQEEQSTKPMSTNKVSYLKYGEPNPLQNTPISQNDRGKTRPPPLIESLHDILKKLMDHHIII